ncbi:MAG: tryptophan-rich sensory protein [Deltaproteobacteria bacterium]|nr:tryptophan-rich sensory protein [Nannocystaceae bacterium]
MKRTTKEIAGSVIGLAAVTGLNTWASNAFRGDEEFYASLDQPPWAPPGWVFAPVWAVNNLLNVYADLRMASRSSGAARVGFGASQAAFWATFFGFGVVYFRKRSPVLGFIATAAGTVATAASVGIAARVDKKAALALAPTALWLAFATAVSGVVAKRNLGRDPYFAGR